MPITVLITGFEPFGDAAVNPSELIVKEIAAAGDPAVVTAILPTSYRQAEANITNLIHQHHPSAVLMFGLKQQSTQLCLENIARNLDDSDALDNDGEVRAHQCIIENAPAKYEASLQFNSMAQIAENMGEAVDYSNNAGGYVCNHAYYAAAHLVATEFESIQFGFVHVPPLDESPYRLKRIVEIVREWVKLLQR